MIQEKVLVVRVYDKEDDEEIEEEMVVDVEVMEDKYNPKYEGFSFWGKFNCPYCGGEVAVDLFFAQESISLDYMEGNGQCECSEWSSIGWFDISAKEFARKWGYEYDIVYPYKGYSDRFFVWYVPEEDWEEDEREEEGF